METHRPNAYIHQKYMGLTSDKRKHCNHFQWKSLTRRKKKHPAQQHLFAGFEKRRKKNCIFGINKIVMNNCTDRIYKWNDKNKPFEIICKMSCPHHKNRMPYNLFL